MPVQAVELHHNADHRWVITPAVLLVAIDHTSWTVVILTHSVWITECMVQDPRSCTRQYTPRVLCTSAVYATEDHSMAPIPWAAMLASGCTTSWHAISG